MSGHGLLRVLLPHTCCACGRRRCDDLLCRDCRRQLRETAGAGLAGIGAVVTDHGPAASLVRAGKLRGARQAARMMAELSMAAAHDGAVEIPAVSVVTWVPADPVRGVRRGHHLPELYARRLARWLQLPAEPLLQRRYAPAQRGTSRHARQQNVRGLYRPLSSCLALNGGTRVLLVDDVCTTGATLRAAAAALATAGLEQSDVAPWAFAWVPRHIREHSNSMHAIM